MAGKFQIPSPKSQPPANRGVVKTVTFANRPKRCRRFALPPHSKVTQFPSLCFTKLSKITRLTPWLLRLLQQPRRKIIFIPKKGKLILVYSANHNAPGFAPGFPVFSCQRSKNGWLRTQETFANCPKRCRRFALPPHSKNFTLFYETQ